MASSKPAIQQQIVKSPRKQAKEEGFSPSVQKMKVSKLKTVPDRKCSWCEQTCDQVRVTHHIAKRSKFECTNCLRTTVKCRLVWCKGMSRAHRGWHEGFCIDHHPMYKEKVVNTHCSWCFEKTNHTIHMDSIFNKIAMMGKIFDCDSCHRPTSHCKECDAMARFGGENTTKKCFKCAGLISSWDNPKANSEKLSHKAWCPWCLNDCPQSVKYYHKSKKEVRSVYTCSNCQMDTKKCNSCDTSMILGCSKQSKCDVCQHPELGINYWKQGKEKFDGMCNSYTMERAGKEIDRKSKFEQKATEAGLIRPFLLLVSMHPQMRSQTAFHLEIPLLKTVEFGDPHAEADLILFHKKKGLQRRSNAILESAGLFTKCNWYSILRRAINDVAGYTTFVSKRAKATMNECADPSSELLNALEVELLDQIAQRHLQMMPIELRDKAIQMYDDPAINEMFNQSRAEGLDSDAVNVMFIAIVISCGAKEGKLSMNISSIHMADFKAFLESYLQGTTKAGDRVHNAQFASGQVVFFIARVVVVGTLVQVVGGILFPPLIPFISIGLLTIGISMFIAAFVCRGSRDVACPAVILIVFQHFLLETQNIDLKNHIDMRSTRQLDIPNQPRQ